LAFDLDLDKDTVRRVLATHYRPDPNKHGPSWLTTIGHAKDSLWSVDLFRCESILLKSHWVMLVMDQYTRRIIGSVRRGCVYDPATMGIVERAEEQFGFVEIQVLSFADMYAGKIMAALDRQHPRDLFDIHELLVNEGLSPELMNALVIYLISHDHAPDKLLAPKEKDISHEYQTGFSGMTEHEVSLDTLVSTRISISRF